ncbi:MAG: aminotransferase class I/II-fold pyridoxal phosphate-dependent enzyme [Pacificimonas sp.]|jgi:histidinol-phosphate aminotransferase|nr:aminotransferase class I/II-fold pyridoxal phosphate-dependent enzyme [Pacificimonas sp.]
MVDPAPIPPPAIEAMEPYVSARMLTAFSKDATFLDANENPFDPDLGVFETDGLQHYADEAREQLEHAYARFAGVDAECVFAARGIDEVIDLVVKAFCEPHIDRVAAFTPTYGQYRVTSDIQRCAFTSLPYDDSLSLQDGLAKIAAGDFRVVFLCRPNNPTGHLAPGDEVDLLLKTAPRGTIIAVDEAYIEFCHAETCVDRLKQFPNLVVMRTLSKAFGLAGIHTGFCLADKRVLTTLAKVANPYPLPGPCSQIALRALEDDNVAQMQNRVRYLCEVRDSFAGELRSLVGMTRLVASETNFVAACFADGPSLYAELRNRGIHIRELPPMLGQSGWLRFSIGTREQMEDVLGTLVDADTATSLRAARS